MSGATKIKLNIFTTLTDPERRGDNFKDALRCYSELADEVVVVNGGDQVKLGFILEPRTDVINGWPEEFSWEFIGQQMQRGYEACSGDWAIRADIDMLWHEKDFAAIRQACEQNPDAPGLSFYKHQFILPDRYNLKSRLVLAVNKRKYGKRIRFNAGGDLCQPSYQGREITPDSVPEARIPIYNYEKLLKTEAQIRDDVGRMARAWHSHFGEYRLGGPDDESAYQEWLKMTLGRFQKPQEQVPLEAHPKFIQDTIRSLTPEQFGYSGFGNLPSNNYIN